MEESYRIKYLLEQVQQRTATRAELDELLGLIRSDEDGSITAMITRFHSDLLRSGTAGISSSQIDWPAAAAEVLQVTRRAVPVRRVPLHRTWWAAASIVVLIGSCLYFFWTRSGTDHDSKPPVVAGTEAIAPGSNGAILTLGDGRQLVLDSLQNGVVAVEAGTELQLQHHQLQYENKAQSATTFNTLTTPRGRLFTVVLPDGTKAWLNAASSIRYPTAFIGEKREVAITGEVYFEVAELATKPFSVRVSESVQVQVLGTSFNVNAYSNEQSINTTLIEGKVKVMAGASPAILTPGKQARIKAGKIEVLSTDTDKVMAWKNGWFNFEGVTLQEIMRQLERWYDIGVVYPNGVPDIDLHGEMTRDVTLQGLLRGLKELGLQYKLEGKQLIILP
ncbi:FecR family protein [Pseudobacter ginsenosidimutans]|jgi:ferric-dicitrate binding protein FerR (iron transport regulator)|uniref:FecR family protein n=1 Tax=Pseudobacter ginsenosidimutans TaxID=661488 RepID=A0A4Q7MG94_9BACT|nr:FecR family protein [Pseudobacter ginsenosidimutans]QEC45164.1 DUF4974 domain-containing protein [Pseudobacter ginsenosidimutans]RZS65429.1 FecR family protein [Pseudobacter ginsenosidimutans]